MWLRYQTSKNILTSYFEPPGSSWSHLPLKTPHKYLLIFKSGFDVSTRTSESKCSIIQCCIFVWDYFLFIKQGFTSLRAGAQQVYNVVMVTKIAENLQLRHQSFTLLRVSARCVLMHQTKIFSIIAETSCKQWWTTTMMETTQLTFEHLDSNSGDVVGSQTVRRRFDNLSKCPRTDNSTWPRVRETGVKGQGHIQTKESLSIESSMLLILV